MSERGAVEADIVHGLCNATLSTVQDNGRWRLDSADLGGEELILLLVIEADFIVWTID